MPTRNRLSHLARLDSMTVVKFLPHTDVIRNATVTLYVKIAQGQRKAYGVRTNMTQLKSNVLGNDETNYNVA